MGRNIVVRRIDGAGRVVIPNITHSVRAKEGRPRENGFGWDRSVNFKHVFYGE